MYFLILLALFLTISANFAALVEIPREFYDNEFDAMAKEYIKEQQYMNFQASGFASAISDINSAISTATSAWSLVKSIFSSSTNYTIEQTLAANGFDYFEVTGQSQSTFGVYPQYTMEYTQLLANTIDLPDNQVQAFQDFLLESTFASGSNTWTAHHMIYNSKTASASNPGAAQYSLFLSNHNTTTNQTNWIYTVFSAQFSLAPEILIIDKSTSKYGGLFQDSTLQYKDIPTSLTLAEVQDVFDFFYYVGIKSIANLLGISAQFPNLPKPPTEVKFLA